MLGVVFGPSRIYASRHSKLVFQDNRVELRSVHARGVCVCVCVCVCGRLDYVRLMKYVRLVNE
jgi:hypothetical protein